MRSLSFKRNVRMLLMSLLILTASTAVYSQETQRTDSALVSQTTALAQDVNEQRLLKTLDALEKAEKALGYALDEIEARKRLDELKDRIIAVKNTIIEAQDELIRRLQKKDRGLVAALKKALKVAEKVVLIGLGAYLGRGL
jgi:pimeloyl-CoA synthetase